MTCGRLQLAFFFNLITECFQGPHVTASGINAVIFHGWMIFCCVDPSRFVRLPPDERAGSLHCLALTSNAALTLVCSLFCVRTVICISLWLH